MDFKVIVGAVGLLSTSFLLADTVTWTGGDGENPSDWFSPANWNTSNLPKDSDDVIIPSNSKIILSNSTPALASIEISGTLTFTNWTTCLNASIVTIKDNAKITSAGSFTTSQMSNRVWIACVDLSLAAKAAINVSECGWDNLQGPGHGVTGYCAAGYGGRGGLALSNTKWPLYAVDWGLTYGNASAPTDPGSGSGGRGGHATYIGGPGGGAVRIDASGHVEINGSVTAKGCNSSSGIRGGASGGSIWISAKTVSGSGTISVSGGTASNTNGECGGGGGRIALTWSDSEAQKSYAPSFVFDCGGAEGVDRIGTSYNIGEPGTLYLSDNSFFPGEKCKGGGRVIYANKPDSIVLENLVVQSSALMFEQLMPIIVEGDLVVTNKGVFSAVKGQSVTVMGDLIVDGSTNIATLELLENARLNVGKNLLLRNKAYMNTFAGDTNETVGVWGVDISVGRTFEMQNQSRFYPRSFPTNGLGGPTRLTAKNITIENGAMINGIGAGYQLPYNKNTYTSNGPGGSTSSYGASHAGLGGGRSNGVYGNPLAPLTAGSSGTYNIDSIPRSGTSGGGQIYLDVQKLFHLDGIIDMSAKNGKNNGNYYGAGSGGSIYIRAMKLTGDGYLYAKGGNGGTAQNSYSNAWPGNSCGGGGGYITIYTDALTPYISTFGGELSVDGGLAYTNGTYNAETGRYETDYRGYVGIITGISNPPKGMMIIIR